MHNTDDAKNKINRRTINRTSTLRRPNRYTQALEGEFSKIAFSEERAPLNKGKWRELVFQAPSSQPMDLEIGTGNGYHFAHHCLKNPQRLTVGIELKYRPLWQAIRRAVRNGSKNAAICRFHAFNIEDLFVEGELNDIYIHFPDPWTSPKKPRNRIVSSAMLAILHRLQRPGTEIEFKTDSREMFLWSLEEIKNSPYDVIYQTLDLHKSESEWAQRNFVTFFESIFMKEGVPINYIRLKRRD